MRFPFFLGLPMVIILPPIATIIGILVAVIWWVRYSSKNGIAIKTGILASGVIGSGFVLWSLYAIRTSCSSTAAIGYLFLPYYTSLVCATAYLLGWSITTIVLFFCGLSGKTWNIKQKKWSVYAAVCIVALPGFWTFKITVRNLLLRKAYVSTSQSELNTLYDKAVSNQDIELMANLVNNPNTSETLLSRIYSSIPDSAFKYPGSNYSRVFSELARNKKTPPDILASLSEKRPYERFFIATNPNTPLNTLEQLAEDKDSQIRTWLCTNPNVTKEILTKLKNDPDQTVRNYADTFFSLRGFSDK
jgi:hypothetical protein